MSTLADLQALLYDELPEFATKLIRGREYRDRNDPYRDRFATNPDDPEMHAPKWHQWGIVTHTTRVGDNFRNRLPDKLGEWFGPQAAESCLGLRDETVDGFSKWDLLLTSVPTHDWGKFAVRRIRSDGARPEFRFGGHERESGELVRSRAGWFGRQGMSEAAVEYIARCSELHFELGKVRDLARFTSGYSLEWVRSEDFAECAGRVAAGCPGFEREVGLFFLADNWGKTDLWDSTEFESDQAIQALRGSLEAGIKERRLHHNLVECTLQLPVNTAVGRRYLELLNGRIPG